MTRLGAMSETVASSATHSATKRRALSQEEWHELKPVIEDLYLKKNWNFSQIARHLGEHFDFEPTYASSSSLCSNTDPV